MTQFLDIDAIQRCEVKQQPYPHFTLDQSLVSEHVEAVMRDFPEINQGGSFPLDKLESGPEFNALIEELNGPEFRSSISDKLGLDLNTLPMIVTLRGISRAKDGRVHTDSESKIATILIYFNEPWTAETGKLRVLNSKNLEDVAGEITPNAGAMIGFRVTDNCWHGYPPFEGTRRSIQINFVADEAAVKKHRDRHGWTAKLKNLKKIFGT